MFILLAIIPLIFVTANDEALDKFAEERALGAEWHYVGKQPVDPDAKSIPLQVEGEEPYILYKLKMPDAK